MDQSCGFVDDVCWYASNWFIRCGCVGDCVQCVKYRGNSAYVTLYNVHGDARACQEYDWSPFALPHLQRYMDSWNTLLVVSCISFAALTSCDWHFFHTAGLLIRWTCVFPCDWLWDIVWLRKRLVCVKPDRYRIRCSWRVAIAFYKIAWILS